MVFSNVLAIILVVAVFFNQVTYYVKGDALDSSDQTTRDNVWRVAYNTSIVITYLVSAVSWVAEPCFAISDELDVASMPLTWVLLFTGLIMFCGIIGCVDKDRPFIPGIFLSGINIFVSVLVLAGI
jgi:hypothetical protein